MPAYNYYPATYQPLYYPQIPQPIQQPQQTQPQPPTHSSIIWIGGGEKEAAMYPVAPNNAVTLWSTTEPVVYLKQADASGKPTMKTYDLVERSEAPVSSQTSQTDKETGYATKDDLSHVESAVKSIDEIVEMLKSDIETIKSDMYGIAGKKKRTKQTEVEEDE